MPTYKHTYNKTGNDQVPIVALEDHRQITAVVGGTLAGNLIPLQLIFTGQDKIKTQQKSVPTLTPLMQQRVDSNGWHLTQTKSHWSTLGAMEDYLRKIVDPWVKAHSPSSESPHAIIICDCWSVHRSKEFREHVATYYPNYHLVFVPAGCTGKAQPADVVLQRPLKHQFSSLYTEWTTSQIISGLKTSVDAPALIEKKISILKPLAVEWMMNSWLQLRERHSMIAAGWKKIGIDKALTEERRKEAQRKAGRGEIKLDDADEKQETNSVNSQCGSFSDELDLEADSLVEDVDDDEEEANIDEVIVAAREEKPISGTRRSARVQAREEVNNDAHLARQIQETDLRQQVDRYRRSGRSR